MKMKLQMYGRVAGKLTTELTSRPYNDPVKCHSETRGAKNLVVEIECYLNSENEILRFTSFHSG
jgi:hypothetical protein